MAAFDGACTVEPWNNSSRNRVRPRVGTDLGTNRTTAVRIVCRQGGAHRCRLRLTFAPAAAVPCLALPQELLLGLRRGGSSAAAWLAASDLLMEDGSPDAALDAAKQVGAGRRWGCRRVCGLRVAGRRWPGGFFYLGSQFWSSCHDVLSSEPGVVAWGQLSWLWGCAVPLCSEQEAIPD